MSEYALRFNESKLDWTLLDFRALEPLVHAMTYGATKYDRDNWKRPCRDPREHLQSGMRHLISVIQGEEYDESTVRHTGHVLANMMMYNFHTSSMAPKLIKAIEQVAKKSEECHHVYTAHRDPYCTVCGKLLI